MLYLLLPLVALLLAPLTVQVIAWHLHAIRQQQADWEVQDAVEARALETGVSGEDAAALAAITTAPPVTGPVLARPWRLAAYLGVAMAAVTAVLVARLPSPWLLPAFGVATVLGAVLFVVDARTKRLPQTEIGALLLAAVLLLPVAGFATGEWHPWRALASAGVWALVFFLPWFATAGRGMGFGDVQLAPVVGLLLGWLGWGASLVGLFAGFALGAVVGIGLMLRRRATRKTAVPYGPFLLAGALLGIVCGQALMHTYLGFMGLGGTPVGVTGIDWEHLGGTLQPLLDLLQA